MPVAVVMFAFCSGVPAMASHTLKGDEVCCTSITFLESQKRKPARASCDVEERAVLSVTTSQLNFTSQPYLKDGEHIEL